MLFILAKQNDTFTSEQLNKCFEKVKQSVISDHLLTCDSHINFSGLIILSKDANNFHLLIKESLLIAGDKPILKKIG